MYLLTQSQTAPKLINMEATSRVYSDEGILKVDFNSVKPAIVVYSGIDVQERVMDIAKSLVDDVKLYDLNQPIAKKTTTRAKKTEE